MRFITTTALTLVAFFALATAATAAPDQAKSKQTQPRLSIAPKRVDAGERFTLTARGFTPGATVVVEFAITGQAPYGTYTPPTSVLADGTYSLPFVFEACGNSPDDLTITLVDSFGVRASARLVLC